MLWTDESKFEIYGWSRRYFFSRKACLHLEFSARSLLTARLIVYGHCSKDLVRRLLRRRSGFWERQKLKASPSSFLRSRASFMASVLTPKRPMERPNCIDYDLLPTVSEAIQNQPWWLFTCHRKPHVRRPQPRGADEGWDPPWHRFPPKLLVRGWQSPGVGPCFIKMKEKTVTLLSAITARTVDL